MFDLDVVGCGECVDQELPDGVFVDPDRTEPGADRLCWDPLRHDFLQRFDVDLIPVVGFCCGRSGAELRSNVAGEVALCVDPHVAVVLGIRWGQVDEAGLT